MPKSGLAMWVGKSETLSRRVYEKNLRLPRPYSVTRINGIPKFSRAKRIYTEWEETKLGKVPEKKPLFGISLLGILPRRGGSLIIDPKELESKVFYLFSYKDEKYVARKVDENIVEVYEVLP